MKKFFSVLLVALMLSLTINTSALAAEEPLNEESEKEEYDFRNYSFPEDAVVLYQGEDGVVYQSIQETKKQEKNMLRGTMKYNGVWIKAGDYTIGSFSIENPHTIALTTKGTFKVESKNSQARAKFLLTDGIYTYANESVKASDGDVHFEFRSNVKNLIVTYYVEKTSNSSGMRLNCWLW